LSVSIVEQEGEYAGLSEIEAFSGECRNGMKFIKLMDDDGNFAYDYQMPKCGHQVFYIYRYGFYEGFPEHSCYVECDNSKCSVALNKDYVDVRCPLGEKCKITVAIENTDICDSVMVKNEFQLVRTVMQFWINNEEKLRKMTSYMILQRCREGLRHIMIFNKIEKTFMDTV
jgi:hypothetical protein